MNPPGTTGMNSNLSRLDILGDKRGGVRDGRLHSTSLHAKDTIYYKLNDNTPVESTFLDTMGGNAECRNVAGGSS